MARRSITGLCIGGGLGAAQSMAQLLIELRRPLPCPVLIQAGESTDLLFSLLPVEWRTSGHLRWAHDGDDMRPGQLLLSPRSHALSPRADGHVKLQAGPAHAIDQLFEGAAKAWGEGAIAILFGSESTDGTDGLTAIRAHGGVRIVQSPIEGRPPVSTAHVILTDDPSAILLVNQMVRTLNHLLVDQQL